MSGKDEQFYVLYCCTNCHGQFPSKDSLQSHRKLCNGNNINQERETQGNKPIDIENKTDDNQVGSSSPRKYSNGNQPKVIKTEPIDPISMDETLNCPGVLTYPTGVPVCSLVNPASHKSSEKAAPHPVPVKLIKMPDSMKTVRVNPENKDIVSTDFNTLQSNQHEYPSALNKTIEKTCELKKNDDVTIIPNSSALGLKIASVCSQAVLPRLDGFEMECEEILEEHSRDIHVEESYQVNISNQLPQEIIVPLPIFESEESTNSNTKSKKRKRKNEDISTDRIISELPPAPKKVVNRQRKVLREFDEEEKALAEMTMLSLEQKIELLAAGKGAVVLVPIKNTLPLPKVLQSSSSHTHGRLSSKDPGKILLIPIKNLSLPAIDNIPSYVPPLAKKQENPKTSELGATPNSLKAISSPSIPPLPPNLNGSFSVNTGHPLPVFNPYSTSTHTLPVTSTISFPQSNPATASCNMISLVSLHGGVSNSLSNGNQIRNKNPVPNPFPIQSPARIQYLPMNQFSVPTAPIVGTLPQSDLAGKQKNKIIWAPGNLSSGNVGNNPVALPDHNAAFTFPTSENKTEVISPATVRTTKQSIQTKGIRQGSVQTADSSKEGENIVICYPKNMIHKADSLEKTSTFSPYHPDFTNPTGTNPLRLHGYSKPFQNKRKDDQATKAKVHFKIIPSKFITLGCQTEFESPPDFATVESLMEVIRQRHSQKIQDEEQKEMVGEESSSLRRSSRLQTKPRYNYEFDLDELLELPEEFEVHFRNSTHRTVFTQTLYEELLPPVHVNSEDAVSEEKSSSKPRQQHQQQQRKKEDSDFNPDSSSDEEWGNNAEEEPEFEEGVDEEEDDEKIIQKRKYRRRQVQEHPRTLKLEEHEDKFTIEKKTLNDGSERKFYTCSVCDFGQCFTDDALKRHLFKHVNKRYLCPICSFNDLTGDLTDHLNSVHKDELPFTCEDCDQKFITRLKLGHHKSLEHGQHVMKCSYCEAGFTFTRQYRKHLVKEHEGKGLFVCNNCPKTYLVKKMYDAHVERGCTKGKYGEPWLCPECGFRGSGDSSLPVHQERVHNKRRHYACDKCPFAAYTYKQLRDHLATHTGVFLHKCPHCEFRAAKWCQVHSHLRTHTGNKPYKCDQCNYRSAWNIQLRTHRGAHCSRFMVMCEPCGIAFKDSRGLSLHQKKEHAEKDDTETESNVVDDETDKKRRSKRTPRQVKSVKKSKSKQVRGSRTRKRRGKSQKITDDSTEDEPSDLNSDNSD